MGRILHGVAAALSAIVLTSACEVFAQAEANLQSLFVGLTQGTEVTLVTPLANGMAEVTSFSPPGRLSAAEAAGALERARQQLAALGVAQPSGQQLALALVGGTVDIPTGRTQLGGVLPPGTQPASIRSKLVAASALPQGQVPGAGGAALTHAEVAQALHLATQQLALHGIVNPTAEQIRVAMFGGTLAPPSGPLVLLPGVVPGTPAARGSAAVGGTAAAAPVAPAARPVVPSR